MTPGALFSVTAVAGLPLRRLLAPNRGLYSYYSVLIITTSAPLSEYYRHSTWHTFLTIQHSFAAELGSKKRMQSI